MNIQMTGFLSLAFALSLAATVQAGYDRPLTPSNAKFDPAAKQVDMFDAMDDGAIEVKLVAKDSTGGNFFISNQTQEPLTVKLPAGFAAVPVAAQFGNAGGLFGAGSGNGFSGTGLSANGFGNQQGAQQGGQQQSVGGGFGNGNNVGSSQFSSFGNSQFNGGSPFGNGQNGFFSIPAEKTLRIPFVSVCLNHGLNEPVPRTQYIVMPVEKFSEDPVLQSLIFMVGTGKLDQRTAQAATWHIANGMSWKELAAKGKNAIRVPGDNYFSKSQLQAAQQIVDIAQAIANEHTNRQPSLVQQQSQPQGRVSR